jgi:hypothetical protein
VAMVKAASNIDAEFSCKVRRMWRVPDGLRSQGRTVVLATDTFFKRTRVPKVDQSPDCAGSAGTRTY